MYHYHVVRKALAVALVVGAALPAVAHHSFAMFDRDKQVTLKGTVKQYQWTNPHVFVQLLVPNQKGEAEEWSIEGASPNMLFREGWSNKTFQTGDQVTIVANPLRDGSHGGSLIYAQLPNGKTIGTVGYKPPG